MIIRKLEKIFDYIEKIEVLLSISILIFTIVSLSVEIVCRYFLFGSLGWPSELSLRLFIWLVFFGLSIHLKNNTLISVDIFYKKYSEKIRNFVDATFDIFVLIFFVYLFKKLLILYKIQNLRTLTTIDIPQSIGLLGPLVSILFCIPVIGLKFYKRINR